MFRSVNIALMEAENGRRVAHRTQRLALHPLAEFYGDWERMRETASEPTDARMIAVSPAMED